MEDQSSYSQKKTPFHDQELLKCPRCDSSNTKFCYYNNYNLSQPRHFCKNCRRYWTKGGTLRNIPVGGSSRKNTKRISSNTKRASSLSSISDYPKQEHSSSASSLLYYNHLTVPGYVNDPRFGSHFDANGQFGSTLEGLNPTGGLQFAQNQINSGTGFGLNSAAGGDGFESSKINSEVGFMEVQNGGDSSCWSATTSNGWPNLAIYTPGPNF